MRIGFTGHRNKLADPNDLLRVLKDYPGAVWVHGGAIGFDRQVEGFAVANGIVTEVHQPDYRTHGKSAPLARNRDIISSVSLLVALWDGRISGGTYYTVKHAERIGLETRVLKP